MIMKVLIIDNYDSFVYNIYQYVGELVSSVIVRRNDIQTKDVKRICPDKIIISPGPSVPQNAGNTIEIIKTFYEEIPILGICLGHQAIGVAFGCKIRKARKIMHGKVSNIYHKGKGILKGIQNPFIATRYHSLVIDDKDFNNDALEIVAYSMDDNEIMAVQHRKYPVFGVQFHPESILTMVGKEILKNFLFDRY